MTSRRTFLVSLPALAAVPLVAETPAPLSARYVLLTQPSNLADMVSMAWAEALREHRFRVDMAWMGSFR